MGEKPKKVPSTNIYDWPWGLKPELLKAFSSLEVDRFCDEHLLTDQTCNGSVVTLPPDGVYKHAELSEEDFKLHTDILKLAEELTEPGAKINFWW